MDMIERLTALAKQNRRTYREAIRDFRKQFTLKSTDRIAAKETA
jgi:hypothetical protein